MNLLTISKIFTDDADPDQSENLLNSELIRISECTNQRNNVFHPDPTKQAVEVYFSRKRDLHQIPDIYFDNVPVMRCESTKKT